MKKTLIAVAIAITVIACSVPAKALQVSFTYTADNIVKAFLVPGSGITTSPASNANNWQLSDNSPLDLASGTSYTAYWLVQNLNLATPGQNDPMAFLGQIAVAGKPLYLSGASWKVSDDIEGAKIPSDWDNAKAYYANGDTTSIWYKGNGNKIVSGIDPTAYWIGYEDYPGQSKQMWVKAEFSTAVPEPSTLILLGAGFGLMGIIGAKRRG